MAQAKPSKTDDRYVEKIRAAFDAYRVEHPRASVDAKRRNSACVRVRVIDPDFKDVEWVNREELIWSYLSALPEEIQSQISMLVLVTPEERKTSLANLEFEHPSRSLL